MTVITAGSVTVVLAADPTPIIDENLVSPGLLGFLSFVFLIVAVVLLYRSMNKQMKKVSPDLPDGPMDRLREEDREITAEAEARGAQEAARRRAGAQGAGPADGVAGTGPDGS